MAWSWRERAEENNTDWIQRLGNPEGRPTFEEIADAASEGTNGSMGWLDITTYDPYTGDTYTDDVRIDDIDDSTIIGSDGQIRIFVLPDLTAGHFDTQGGTDRMPDLVIDYDTKK